MELPIGFGAVKYTPMLGGGCWLYRFSNGYGASVVCHGGSYGGDEGLFEVLVAQFPTDKLSWDCAHGVDIDGGNGDPAGWLTLDDVARILGEINALARH